MKTILITGAASGLGWAMAQQWFAAGHRLVLADINADLLAEREAQLNAPERVLAVVADITNADDIQKLIQATEQQFGRLDRLVNNAGITHRSPAHQTDPARRLLRRQGRADPVL